MFTQFSIRGVSLDAAGLVALADLKSIAIRTALTGSASMLDILFLAPGIHCQRDASEVNGGEHPTAGAMTNGYVFHIENQATVSYLQTVGKTGHLTTIRVSGEVPRKHGLLLSLLQTDFWATALYLIGIALTAITLVLLGVIRDWWGLGVVCMLLVARILNVLVIRRRTVLGWKGAPEPGVEGDLLILLSQDRWVRMRGMVDDIKNVTAGQWLREEETVESFVVSFATLLVYGSAALAGNASTVGSLLMACLLLVSAGILGLCNAATKTLRMFDRIVSVEGEPKRYERRLEMAHDLVLEMRRDDWAVDMGLIKKPYLTPEMLQGKYASNYSY
ncbi:hypothetical protein PHLGIDRAFT_506217 [Phlebiopsis gigantea 11061_1 CR5-6]|uniref:Uncharacterized protein n=1 Tax=Phlebiopsis gigantea (strain 11061_1 CR5-6) TaxID=745531 RepID=A0A0C3S1J4_PHLG1|nr:hypothetical protein PHLGIDRAFT_506217 [Phlebiopsis gigantea 11061_1 CR5-6]